MPKNPVFDLARGKATLDLITSHFSASDAYLDGDEYWTRNPLRGDSSVGSFSINVNTGLWSDFATDEKGDLIKLLVDSGRAPSLKAAAEMIVSATGGTTPDQGTPPARSHLDRPAKVKAVIPIPADALPKLEARVKGKWAQEKHGTATKSWAWRLPSGEAWCCTTRYERDGKKDVIPHYWGEDGKWHEGDPMSAGRHLYRVDQVNKADSGTHILVVEGEKKASVKVDGYLLTTWIAGAKAWDKSDWSPLERFAKAGLVTIWPDADEPGVKAAMAISKRLPGSRIMDIKGKTSGWDLADAVAEGIDPVAFIDSCPMIGGPSPSEPDKVRPDDQWPFLCLGYDKGGYYFMRKDRRVVFSIGMGSFNASKLGELAGVSWWTVLGHVSDQGTIKVAGAQDDIVGAQQQVGFFDPKRIRGAGVWRDQDGIILNDGRRIVTMDGRSFQYQDYKTTFYYVPSLVAFGEMHGPESTDDDGAKLEDLFKALEFEDMSQAIMLMGWCLIAPFGGVLKWRPHIWLTGQKGSGKSWAMDNIVVPLCGPFAYVGSGKDTEAGIRWALDQDARPSILAEMEPKNKTSREKIASILELARNASDDGSGSINISQAGGGTKSFRIRSMFAFSSKVMPAEDDAVNTRITRLDLVKPKDEDAKIRRTVALVAELMDDPGRFTRRIFHALPRILSDIEWIRSNFLGVLGSQRAADQVSPMIATAWAAQSSRPVREAGLWLEKWIAELGHESKLTQGDEDTFMYSLVGLGLRTDDGKTRTVAELLAKVADAKEGDETALALLERHGITLRRKYLTSPWVLSVATSLPALASLFKDTQWGDGYGFQIKRNVFTVAGPTRSIRMKCGKPRCHDLDWNGFRARYMGEDETGQPGLDLMEADDGPPF